MTKNDEGPKVPQSDEYGTPNAQAWDADGNVRPADGRWLGDANDDLTAEKRLELREKELADADEKLAEKMREQNAGTPPADPSQPGDGPADADQEPVTSDNPAIGEEPFVQEPSTADPYADLSYAELQQAAKARDLNAGGSGEEIKARLIQADADTNSGITPTE